jgi:glycosyltransferase involved in cell wall biosynthesis
MKISYAITVCNEVEEIKELVTFLLEHKDIRDEIVITFDHKNGSKEVEEYLRRQSDEISWHTAWPPFERDFSKLKNYTKSMCKGDYIFHLDADEYPHEILIEQLPTILETNDVDLIWIPRVNTVEGLTDEWANKWGWRVTENGWVNYPDYQSRVFRNVDEIFWQNKVHERIVGAKTYAHLPPHEELSLYHHKTIDKQIKQNKLYEGIV